MIGRRTACIRPLRGTQSSPSNGAVLRISRRRAVTAIASWALLGCASGGGGSVVSPPSPPPPPPPPPPPAWTLVWSDEFDGAAGTPIDTTYWRYDIGDGCLQSNCGWGNNEKEYYTSDTSNIALNGQGQLRIVARVAPVGLSCYYGACRYTSAKITTRGKVLVTAGRVEASIQLAAGQGLWPAFWMLGTNIGTVGWPTCGELDIMENRGSNTNQMSSAQVGHPTVPILVPSIGTVGWPTCGELDIMENRGSNTNQMSSAVHGPGYSGNTP